ncbi:hypothetical protein [Ensifer adhaerens]|uniref:hypothetical protein n=1 Tax=Ensifer adhaerens TaxID=106592 RepID=UPI00131A0F28|nr:hypothetical protein [Ensifer adhaerens]
MANVLCPSIFACAGPKRPPLGQPIAPEHLNYRKLSEINGNATKRITGIRIAFLTGYHGSHRVTTISATGATCLEVDLAGFRLATYNLHDKTQEGHGMLKCLYLRPAAPALSGCQPPAPESVLVSQPELLAIRG